MNRADETFQVSGIISRYVLGSMTESEKEELDGWLDKSSRNKLLFEELVRQEVASGKILAYGRVEWEGALKELLEQKKKLRLAGRKRRIIRFGSCAAVLLFACMGIWFYYIQAGNTPVGEEQVHKEIPKLLAGKPRATLQLASGKTVFLTSDSSRSIEPEYGVEIRQDSGVIKYQVAEVQGGQEEQYNMITVPRGGEFTLILSDGTQVWLNAETSLRYPVEFVGNERKVYLEGEAFFDVTRDKQKQFVVETEKAKVRVYGTAFNVYAYPNEDEVAATLVRGAIDLKERGSGNRIRLEPGEQGCLAGGKLAKREVDVDMYTAWITGRMVFKSICLGDMLKHLARWYDVDIVFTEERLKEVSFTGAVKKYDDFTEVLDVIESTQVVHFRIEDRTIIVY